MIDSHSIRQTKSYSDLGRSLLAVVSSVAESTFAGEVAGAEGLARLWPVRAAAAREFCLPILALLCAVLQNAHGAHVGLTHDFVESCLALAVLCQSAREQQSNCKKPF